MSESKWTPGPWEVKVDEDRPLTAIAVICAPDKRSIAVMMGEWIDHQANARLIAAAPDMADALEGLMWRFDDDDSDPHEPEETAPDILAARAALALAKGEE